MTRLLAINRIELLFCVEVICNNLFKAQLVFSNVKSLFNIQWGFPEFVSVVRYTFMSLNMACLESWHKMQLLFMGHTMIHALVK